MTHMLPDETCGTCGSVLVPADVVPWFTPWSTIPKGADYVCLDCGRPYRWVGSPAKLTLIAAGERRDDGDDEAG